MNTEKYFLIKLANLSEEDALLAQEIVKELGSWSKPVEVANYLKRHITTVYDMIENNEIMSRRMKGRLRVFSKSLILILEKK